MEKPDLSFLAPANFSFRLSVESCKCDRNCGSISLYITRNAVFSLLFPKLGVLCLPLLIFAPTIRAESIEYMHIAIMLVSFSRACRLTSEFENCDDLVGYPVGRKAEFVYKIQQAYNCYNAEKFFIFYSIFE